MNREHVNQNWIEEAAEKIIDYCDESGGIMTPEVVEELISDALKRWENGNPDK